MKEAKKEINRSMCGLEDKNEIKRSGNIEIDAAETLLRLQYVDGNRR